MKIIRNSIIFLAALVVSVSAFAVLSDADPSVGAATDYSGQCGADVFYELDPDAGILSISGTGEMYNYIDLDNPAPWYPFKDLIKSVAIGDSVTSVGINCFMNCTSLTSVSIPDSVISIGTSAFSGCTSLASAAISNSVTSLGLAVFEGCTSLTSVTLTESVDTISVSLFEGCTSLTSVTIPNSITQIADFAFKNCGSLTSLAIPDSVEFLHEGAFEGCTGLKELTIPATINSSGSNYYHPEIPIFAGCVNIEKITLTGTGNWFVYDETSYLNTPWQISRLVLTTVIISGGLTSIGDHAFKDCTALKELTVPAGLDCVGTNASPSFEGCVNIQKITFTGSGEWCTYSTDSAQESYFGYTPWQYSKSVLNTVVLSEGITTVGVCAFKDCNALSYVVFPGSVSFIDPLAFDVKFYDSDGKTELAATAANLAGSTFQSTDGKLVKQGSSAPEEESKTIYIIAAFVVLVIALVAVMVVKKRNA